MCSVHACLLQSSVSLEEASGLSFRTHAPCHFVGRSLSSLLQASPYRLVPAGCCTPGTGWAQLHRQRLAVDRVTASAGAIREEQIAFCACSIGYSCGAFLRSRQIVTRFVGKTGLFSRRSRNGVDLPELR